MNLPAPLNQADFALLTSPEGGFWLAYEVARDFLSAPRQFAVLRGDLGEQGEMVWLQPPQQLAEDEFCVADGDQILLSLANRQQELKLRAICVQFIEVRSQQAGPTAALLASLGQHLTG